MPQNDPHQDCEIRFACAHLHDAEVAVVALHGRFGAAEDILKYAEQINVQDAAWLAPHANGGSWWGHHFLAPLSMNEPALSSALTRVDVIVRNLGRLGFGPERIVLAGFSQGACLALEYIARHPNPFRGVVAMSGGLIGNAEGDTVPREALNGHASKQFNYIGNLPNVPIYLGCHVDDPVIPLERVRHSHDILRSMGAQVTLTTAPGSMHGVLPSDINALRSLLTD